MQVVSSGYFNMRCVCGAVWRVCAQCICVHAIKWARGAEHEFGWRESNNKDVRTLMIKIIDHAIKISN